MVDESGSIFDLAGKKSSPHPKRREKALSTPAGPEPIQEIKPVENIEEMFERIEDMRAKCQELNTRLHQIYEKSGYNPERIQNFFQNLSKSNDSSRDWIQKERERFDRQLLKLYGNRPPPKKSKQVVAQEKKRRGKSLGNRRKWLSID